MPLSDCNELVYTPNKMTIQGNNWPVIRTADPHDMCFPITWMTLVNGISNQQPQNDPCFLEVEGDKTKTLVLSYRKQASSINILRENSA